MMLLHAKPPVTRDCTLSTRTGHSQQCISQVRLQFITTRKSLTHNPILSAPLAHSMIHELHALAVTEARDYVHINRFPDLNHFTYTRCPTRRKDSPFVPREKVAQRSVLQSRYLRQYSRENHHEPRSHSRLLHNRDHNRDHKPVERRVLGSDT